MRWHQQNTHGTSTKSCWSPSWHHFSWGLVCCSYYSGLGYMYEGTFKLCPYFFFKCSSFNLELLKPSTLIVFCRFRWLTLKKKKKEMKDTFQCNKGHHTQHELDFGLIGLHWQYFGITWTLDFVSQVKGICTTFGVFLCSSWQLQCLQ